MKLSNLNAYLLARSLASLDYLCGEEGDWTINAKESPKVFLDAHFPYKPFTVKVSVGQSKRIILSFQIYRISVAWDGRSTISSPHNRTTSSLHRERWLDPIYTNFVRSWIGRRCLQSRKEFHAHLLKLTIAFNKGRSVDPHNMLSQRVLWAEVFSIRLWMKTVKTIHLCSR